MLRVVGGGMLATVLAMLLILPAPAGAQTTAKDVEKKTVEAWDTMMGYTVEKKNDAVTHGKKLMREADTKIKKLEEKASKTSGETKAAYDKEIKELKAKRAQTAKKLDDMGKASASSWDATKQGFADAYKDMHQAYEKAIAQLK